MPFCEIGDRRIHYIEHGEGSPVLLLHGWGGSHKSFMPVMAALSGRHRVVALDFPGHGETDEPSQPWSVTEYAQMTLEFIYKVIGGPCNVIGHSFGGRVCIYLAASWPEMVRKLILCDSAGILPRRGPSYYVRVYTYKLGKKMARWGVFRRLLGMLGVDVEKKIKNAGSADYRALSEGMKKTFVRVVNQDLRPLLPKIQAETLLVWGAMDQDTPLYQGKIMEKEIK
ncbi:MAG: alpha/beta fold hydrolase, partial [Christensenellales bacterium]